MTLQIVTREDNAYTFDCSLHLKNVTVEDAGKYKVTARNDLGESNATISLNFDSDEAPVPQVRLLSRFCIPFTVENHAFLFNCSLTRKA